MLIAVIGDIHGRFFRVEQWVETLEKARGQEVALVLAVGDVETFLTADDHRRKATKRAMPAEFAAYATGERTMRRPMVFVGGNNEAFGDLEPYVEQGGEIAPNVRYLGRAGVSDLAGLRVAFLSGIYAPTRFTRPRVAPTTWERSKQAGYFRADDVEVVRHVETADVLLLHEWPRGVAGRDSAVARAGARGIRAPHWTNVGNPHGKMLVDVLRPEWVLCGHLHVPHAATYTWNEGQATRVVCLDQASRPEGGLFWMEWEGREVREAGWGTNPFPTWRAGDPWDERQTMAKIRREPYGER